LRRANPATRQRVLRVAEALVSDEERVARPTQRGRKKRRN
jgi:hypothetical protein